MNGNSGAIHLQPYICSIVHAALSFTQSGGLNVTDLMLVPHTCDSLQGLGSLLLDFVVPPQPVLTLYIPRGKRKSDLDFLANEFRMLYQHLENITGRSPSAVELMACIQREEGADLLLSELYGQRHQLPLDNEAFYRLIRSREYLPAEIFMQLAEDVLAQAGETENNGISVILSGIVPEPMSLFRVLSGLGGCVVADDLACCGRRLYPAGQNQDPFLHMAEQIVYAPPDPTRGSPISERLDHLLKLVKTSGARGVVFYGIKFCEPELFDLPELRRGLREASIPSLTVEVDINDELIQPAITRLAGFIEMIQ